MRWGEKLEQLAEIRDEDGRVGRVSNGEGRLVVLVTRAGIINSALHVV